MEDGPLRVETRRTPDQPTLIREVGPEVPRGLAPFWKPTWSHVGNLGATWGGLGGLLGRSWAVLEASWGLLAAKTHQKRGESEFWKPLGGVLASFLGGFWMAFGMNFQYFSHLIFKDLNMS